MIICPRESAAAALALPRELTPSLPFPSLSFMISLFKRFLHVWTLSELYESESMKISYPALLIYLGLIFVVLRTTSRQFRSSRFENSTKSIQSLILCDALSSTFIHEQTIQDQEILFDLEQAGVFHSNNNNLSQRSATFRDVKETSPPLVCA